MAKLTRDGCSGFFIMEMTDIVRSLEASLAAMAGGGLLIILFFKSIETTYLFGWDITFSWREFVWLGRFWLGFVFIVKTILPWTWLLAASLILDADCRGCLAFGSWWYKLSNGGVAVAFDGTTGSGFKLLYLNWWLICNCFFCWSFIGLMLKDIFVVPLCFSDVWFCWRGMDTCEILATELELFMVWFLRMAYWSFETLDEAWLLLVKRH